MVGYRDLFMNWIEQVAKHHKEYIKTIKSFGEDFYAEDLVQEMYIRFINKDKQKAVIVNGQVNKYYVYLTLRSLFVDFYRQKSRIIKVDLSEVLTLEQIDTLEEHEAFGELLKRVNEETKRWEWYDKMLFDLYRNKNMTMRELQKGTTISLRSIFCTIKNCKERLKENVGEDYLDYVNKDYELI
jgi:DNA-directed RNA polymerase specialized sigma24 family protein